MSPATANLLATVAGVATVAAVLVLALIARRPAARRPSPPTMGSATGGAGAVRARTRRAGRLITAVLAVAALLAIGPWATGAVVVACSVARSARRRAADARRRAAVDAAMPDAIELVVVCIQAGLAPARAIEVAPAYVAPALRPAFEAARLQLHRGCRLGEALGALTRELGPSARELASTIAAADRDGLPLAPVLDRLAAMARDQRRRQGEADARRLPVRLSFPLVTCTLPSFVLLTIVPAVLGALSTLRMEPP